MLSIYKASAGSGKTFTLAYEYIKLLLGYKDNRSETYSLRKKFDDAHRHILAITFTNKATEEMKRRIVLELSRLAGMEDSQDSPYEGMLIEELHCKSDELKSAAGTALRHLLFDFNFFNVSTIDSFFQTILRTFAREAELTGNYEVQLDNSEAIAEGVHRFFNSLTINSADSATRRFIKSISTYLIEQFKRGKNIMLFNRDSKAHADLLKLIGNLSDETFTMRFDEIIEYFSDPKRMELFDNAVAARAQKLTDRCKSDCSDALTVLAALDSLPIKGNCVSQNFINALKNAAADAETDSKTIAKVEAEGPAAIYNKPLRTFIEKNPDYAPDIAVQKAVDAILAVRREVPLLRQIRANLFHLSLMARIYSFIEEYRTENNALLLSDTNGLLRSIIGEDDAPFIYERLGLLLRHYLIDEFQDTSRLQWDNLQPLVKESIASGNDSLVIGDEKQCIYRFRNSDPGLLQSHVGIAFSGSCRTFGDRPSDNTNWRSSADVVNFNNTLFATLASQNGHDVIYANVCQAVSKKHLNHKGYISVTPVECSSVDEYADTVLPQLAQDIDSQLNAGYAPSDIVVLVRNKKEGQKIIDYLIQSRDPDSPHHYNIISDDLIPVSKSPAVRMIISHLQSISEADGNDRQNARYKSRRDTATMLARYELALHSGADASQAMAAALAADNIKPVSATGAATLTDLVENIIASLPEEMLTEQNCHICAFQDLLCEYCAYGLNDVQSFLKWWYATGCRKIISAPEDPNAIRVMTIHKSKGLEFHCVHIPFVNWQVLDFRSVEWFDTNVIEHLFDKAILPPLIPLTPGQSLCHTPFEPHYLERCAEQTLDELNVLYVAFTRAKDELRVHYRRETGANLPMGQLLDNAMTATFTPGEDGTYTFGEPTQYQPEQTKAATDEPVSAHTMQPYFCYEVPAGEEYLEVDQNPEPEL